MFYLCFRTFGKREKYKAETSDKTCFDKRGPKHQQSQIFLYFVSAAVEFFCGSGMRLFLLSALTAVSGMLREPKQDTSFNGSKHAGPSFFSAELSFDSGSPGF